MQEKRPKLKCICPAEGWYAAYVTEDASHLDLVRLMVFAYIEDEVGKTSLDGVDSNLMLCQYGKMEWDAKKGTWILPHFWGFYHEKDLTGDLRSKLAQKALEFFNSVSNR